MSTKKEKLSKIPLTRKVHQIAREFASEQATVQKRKQVYLNTLAVYAMHTYLKLLRIETDLSQSDSWNPGIRTLVNTSDLCIPDFGSLECCPVLPGETTFRIDPDLIGDRIGYVAVEVSEYLDKVQILGFIKASDTSNTSEEIMITALKPIEELLDYIPSNVVDERPVLTGVDLLLWLENIFEPGWSTLSAVFGSEAASPIFSVRGTDFLSNQIPGNSAISISRAKKLDLGMQVAGNPLALIVTITPQVNEKMYARLRLCPSGSQLYLPPEVQLIVFDESGATCPGLGAKARRADNWIQVEFTGSPGEKFSVKIGFSDASITEYFSF